MPSTDTGVVQLVRQLADDSRRLAGDEVRLAKLEIGENIKSASHGALWLAASFGIAVVAAVALTIAAIALVARAAQGQVWIGALGIGVVELALGIILVRRGVHHHRAIDFSFSNSRETLRDTGEWAASSVKRVGRDVARQPSRMRELMRDGLAETSSRPPRAD